MENKKRQIFQRIIQRKNEAEDADSLSFTETKRHQHDIIYDPVIPATCVQEGLTEGIHCRTCGEVIIPQFVVPRHEHRPVERPELASTCTKAGYTKEIYCSECGKIFLSKKELPRVDHDVISGLGIPATCTDEGLTSGTHCRVCGTIITRSEIIPPHGHEWKRSQSVEPTCTQDGMTEKIQCIHCEEYKIRPEIIPALGHDCEKIPEKRCTCTQEGTTMGIRCKRCGIVLQQPRKINALGHCIKTIPGVSPTYGSNGLTEGKRCSRCGKIIKKQEVIPRLIQAEKQLPNKMTIGNTILNTYQDPSQIIYIVSGMMHCTKLNHTIIQMRAIVREQKKHGTIEIPIQRCLQCRFYFIRKDVLAEYEKKYGKLFFNSEEGVPLTNGVDTTQWNDESDLHKYGYNVNAVDNLSSETRHDILQNAIISGHLSQQYIMEQLAMLIQLNQHKDRMKVAVEKWEEDLRWLSFFDIRDEYIHGRLEKYKNRRFQK